METLLRDIEKQAEEMRQQLKAHRKQADLSPQDNYSFRRLEWLLECANMTSKTLIERQKA